MRALTPTGGPPSEPADAGFCDQCGEPVTEGAHGRCADRRRYEPPRFCSECARRMVVQVTPVGWTARCSRHGDRHG